jgi:hypothetical protein
LSIELTMIRTALEQVHHDKILAAKLLGSATHTFRGECRLSVSQRMGYPKGDSACRDRLRILGDSA